MMVHELRCGTLTPPGDAAVWGAPHFTCRCLLVELGGSLLAVDTGIGLEDIEHPGQRLGRDWIEQVHPLLDPAETLVAQVTALGHDPRDITDVILTHHHRDHVGGLSDMPWARVHATPDCRRAVIDADPRIRPAQWEHGVVWAEDPRSAPPWRGFDTYLLPGLPTAIRLVELPGHAPGHAGVLVEGAGRAGTDLLHVGDALYHHGQLTGTEPPAVEAFAAQTQHHAVTRVETQQRLRNLTDVRLMTSHDPAM